LNKQFLIALLIMGVMKMNTVQYTLFFSTVILLLNSFHIKMVASERDSIQIAHIIKMTETDIDSAIKLAGDLKIRAELDNNEYLLPRSLGTISYIYYLTGNYREGNEYGLKAAEIFQRLNQTQSYHETLIRLGAINLLMGNYMVANDYLIKAANYFEKTHDTLNLLRTHINLSGVHIMLDNPESADAYSRKAYHIALKIDNEFATSKALNNIAIVLFRQNRIAEARDSFLVALEKAKYSNENQTILNCLNYLGQIEMMEGNKEKAHQYFNQLVNFRENYVDQFVTSAGMINKGKLYAAMDNLPEAIKWTNLAIEKAKQTGDNAHLKDAYFLMSGYMKSSGRKSEALEFLEKSMALNDSLINEAKQRTIFEMETIYQTSKKEQQIVEIQKEKQKQEERSKNLIILFLFSISLLLIIVTLILLLIRNQQRKNKLDRLELNLRLLRTQLNPHFIFNSLGAVQNYILNRSATEASSYLARFSRLMRLILINSNEKLVSLDNEIETITNYLELQKLRFPERIIYHIKIEDDLNPNEVLIPPMLTQPFIENSIEHNLTNVNQLIHIKIDISLERNKTIQICIEDDGIGREKSAQARNSEQKSFATEITQNRISSLRKTGFKGIDFTISDVNQIHGENPGTKVIFSIPLMMDL
jgi:tetratricopeptide (TPR) repeat protein